MRPPALGKTEVGESIPAVARTCYHPNVGCSFPGGCYILRKACAHTYTFILMQIAMKSLEGYRLLAPNLGRFPSFKIACGMRVSGDVCCGFCQLQEISQAASIWSRQHTKGRQNMDSPGKHVYKPGFGASRALVQHPSST